MYIPILSCFLALKVLHSRSNWTLSCGCLSVKKTSVGQVPPNLAGKKKLVPILKLVREKLEPDLIFTTATGTGPNSFPKEKWTQNQVSGSVYVWSLNWNQATCF
jgi:hypothetical protein